MFLEERRAWSTFLSPAFWTCPVLPQVFVDVLCAIPLLPKLQRESSEASPSLHMRWPRRWRLHVFGLRKTSDVDIGRWRVYDRHGSIREACRAVLWTDCEQGVAPVDGQLAWRL